MPQARLDDVMVSYATPGGGVGPHVDSYDVFLLQGPGRRRWRVWVRARQDAANTCSDPGDLLYLPPGLKHDGVALDACFTYSIGFRAPRGAELGAAFLDWLHERGLPDAAYRDPGLLPAGTAGAHSGEHACVHSTRLLDRIRWSRRDVGEFLGRIPDRAQAARGVPAGSGRRPLARSRCALDPKTQLLYSGERFFINGESLLRAARNAAPLRELADQRSAPGHGAAAPLAGADRGMASCGLPAPREST